MGEPDETTPLVDRDDGLQSSGQEGTSTDTDSGTSAQLSQSMFACAVLVVALIAAVLYYIGSGYCMVRGVAEDTTCLVYLENWFWGVKPPSCGVKNTLQACPKESTSDFSVDLRYYRGQSFYRRPNPTGYK